MPEIKIGDYVIVSQNLSPETQCHLKNLIESLFEISRKYSDIHQNLSLETKCLLRNLIVSLFETSRKYSDISDFECIVKDNSIGYKFKGEKTQ